MEACIHCDVFNKNLKELDWKDTISLIARQLKDYHQQILEKQAVLDESNRRLSEFKKTSIYLLKELDQKSKELQEERNNLEKRVKEKSKELKQIHSKLVQSTKLAAIGRFSAGIAHEINNPLGAIINYTRNLLANPVIVDQNRGYLELILKGLFRIEYIVKQILSYSGGQKTEAKPTDINKLIHDSVQFLQHKLDKKQIEYSYKLSDELPEVMIDPIQLQQVFSNVINNAVDAVNNHGKIEIHTFIKKDNVVIEFADNGRGMSKEEMNQVFDPFYTTKEIGQGAGLGLFISYNILQIYHGNVEIFSHKGKGTQVVIQLPVTVES